MQTASNRKPSELVLGLGFWACTAVIIGSMIGQSIFLVSSQVAGAVGYIIHHGGGVPRGECFSAHPALKHEQVHAQKPAKLRRGVYDPLPRRSAIENRISHAGKDGCEHRGGLAREPR